MVSEKIVIKCKVGLHARPASLFVKEAKMYASTIRVKQDGKDINGKSILEVLTLGATCGSVVEIVASGNDEKKALEALKEIVSRDDI
ncbi:MAG: HPr family phosphocarrier protein [Eubacteriales bacterium]